MIIAIGESLIAIGVGARGTDLGLGVVCAALLGLVVASSFWLAYFDYFPICVQQLLAEGQRSARIALARDVYIYLHLPMVAGIMLFAFAMKVTLAHWDARSTPSLLSPSVQGRACISWLSSRFDFALLAGSVAAVSPQRSRVSPCSQ